MAKPVKVFNRGTRPVVFKRDRTGVDAIHPGKFLTFNEKKAKAIIEKFEYACSEDDFKAHIVAVLKENRRKDDEVAKKQADDQKKAAIEAKKKVKQEE